MFEKETNLAQLATRLSIDMQVASKVQIGDECSPRIKHRVPWSSRMVALFLRKYIKTMKKRCFLLYVADFFVFLYRGFRS